jgi:hypothetical protein
MNPQVRIESLLDRPKSYFNLDGVNELSIGFMCLSFALLQWMQVHGPEDSAWHSMWVFYIYLASMCAILHYGTKAIKEHITYPRTGFVEYRTTTWPIIVGVSFSVLISIGLFLAVRRHWDVTTPGSLIGLLLAASYAYGIARHVRWKWVVAWAMALSSLTIAVLPADLIGALAKHSWITATVPAKLVGAFLLSFTLYGTLLSISGGISFWLYLRRTEAPAQDPQ